MLINNNYLITRIKKGNLNLANQGVSCAEESVEQTQNCEDTVKADRVTILSGISAT